MTLSGLTNVCPPKIQKMRKEDFPIVHVFQPDNTPADFPKLNKLAYKTITTAVNESK